MRLESVLGSSRLQKGGKLRVTKGCRREEEEELLVAVLAPMGR
jgi:hypothetical protein